MSQPEPKPKSDNSDPKSPRGTEKTEKYSVKPEFWESILESIPEWGDEIAGVVLLIFGFISFLAIFDVSGNAPLARAWSDALTGLFGYGSIIVSAGIFLLGIFIFLPKFGIQMKLSSNRILALEVAFIAILALLHFSAGDTEMRAVARAGEGGGAIGGAMSAVISELFGTTTAIVFFVTILFLSIGVAIGVQKAHIRSWLKLTSQRLRTFSDRLIIDTQRTIAATRTTSLNTGDSRSPRTTVMRIRPDPANLPPSKRVEMYPQPPLGIEEPREEQLTEKEKALFAR